MCTDIFTTVVSKLTRQAIYQKTKKLSLIWHNFLACICRLWWQGILSWIFTICFLPLAFYINLIQTKLAAVYLPTSKADWDRQKMRERDFPFTGSLLQCPHQLGLRKAKAKAKAKSLEHHPGLPWGGGVGPKTWTFICCHPRCTSRKSD